MVVPVDDALLLLEKEGTRSTVYDAARAVGGGGDRMKILDPPPLPPMPAVVTVVTMMAGLVRPRMEV